MPNPLNDSLNFATAVRWIATVPFYQIKPDLKTGDVEFNLFGFELPTMTIGSNTVSYNGYEVEIPTNVRTGDKTITFEYLMSSDWNQYKLLWQWANQIAKPPGAGYPEGTNNIGDFAVPISVIVLSEFKKPVFAIKYHDCWIKEFGPIILDYQDGEASVIRHSFTCAYSYFEFEDINN